MCVFGFCVCSVNHFMCLPVGSPVRTGTTQRQVHLNKAIFVTIFCWQNRPAKINGFKLQFFLYLYIWQMLFLTYSCIICRFCPRTLIGVAW